MSGGDTASLTLRVVDVRGLRTAEQRATVVYVGRAFAGWPASKFGNPFKGGRDGSLEEVLRQYHSWLVARPADELHGAFAGLWADTGHGVKPLGCWCGSWTLGETPVLRCHAVVLAKALAAWVRENEGRS